MLAESLRENHQERKEKEGIETVRTKEKKQIKKPTIKVIDFSSM